MAISRCRALSRHHGKLRKGFGGSRHEPEHDQAVGKSGPEGNPASAVGHAQLTRDTWGTARANSV